MPKENNENVYLDNLNLNNNRVHRYIRNGLGGHYLYYPLNSVSNSADNRGPLFKLGPARFAWVRGRKLHCNMFNVHSNDIEQYAQYLIVKNLTDSTVVACKIFYRKLSKIFLLLVVSYLLF